MKTRNCVDNLFDDYEEIDEEFENEVDEVEEIEIDCVPCDICGDRVCATYGETCEKCNQSIYDSLVEKN